MSAYRDRLRRRHFRLLKQVYQAMLNFLASFCPRDDFLVYSDAAFALCSRDILFVKLGFMRGELVAEANDVLRVRKAKRR